MLNHAAFLLLCDRNKVPVDTLRFFMNLMARETIVKHPRSILRYSVIRLRPMFGFFRKDVVRHLKILSDVGLLEVGPPVSVKMEPMPTYRLGLGFRLVLDDLYTWVESVDNANALEELAPPLVPIFDLVAGQIDER